MQRGPFKGAKLQICRYNVLASCYQGSNSVEQYITDFRKAAAQLDLPDEATLIYQFWRGLRKGIREFVFCDPATLQDWRSLDDLMTYVRTYSQLQESGIAVNPFLHESESQEVCELQGSE
jgi:hypothetical protein